jgi:taurine dioxygenase
VNGRGSKNSRFSDGYRFTPLATVGFGGVLEFQFDDIGEILEIFERDADSISSRFYAMHGLLVVKGLQGIRDKPQALVELSRFFGPEVEDYHQTLTSARFFHESVNEILILSNAEPCNHLPPPKPSATNAPNTNTPNTNTPNTNTKGLATRFPDQINWHTDQSYRRPPPDITLLLAIEIPPRDQGQTLFADCTAAFAALDPAQQKMLEGLQGLHAPSWIGRSRAAVERGEKPLDLLPHQLPQRQPLVRRHPLSGEKSLYICEEKQMDFVDGPIVGLETGPDGEGARLLRDLLRHATRDEFVYVHEWEVGDLLIADNRNLLHCATWYDAARYTRLMWRTTVMGNPGSEYAGEDKTWIPRDGSDVMAGMEHA